MPIDVGPMLHMVVRKQEAVREEGMDENDDEGGGRLGKKERN